MKTSLRKSVLGSLALSVAMAAGGCATVDPWERGTLARYSMRPDRDPLATNLCEHVYFSKEASHGGRGVGGGGCGCN